ncbi:uncharacterized protein TM35_000621070 [Trypanosoma theileri]|uniref:Titin n=1 Tax=Trypanosoma theileri TaxID=67003 RepID=A0A1X0NGQ2_9TRYP|nr:uncharacterized protein TM35_000621070 [Trypanosoma theileri]ORC83633.1 hypothetical protein TM35_000621070 [Trypanosoma theileri]
MVMMRYVLCILALLLSCACVHVLAEEVPAADLSDQVPNTESETKMCLEGGAEGTLHPEGAGRSVDGKRCAEAAASGLVPVPDASGGDNCREGTELPEGKKCPPKKPEVPPVKVPEEPKEVVPEKKVPVTPSQNHEDPPAAPHEVQRQHEDNGIPGPRGGIAETGDAALRGQDGETGSSGSSAGASGNDVIPAPTEPTGPRADPTEADPAGEVQTEGDGNNAAGGSADSQGNGAPQTSSSSNNTTTGTAGAADNETTENGNTSAGSESTNTQEGDGENTENTTTTTTTLPPELTNNKKGDADSSSSISSSVWVRVPLLIVVTLACILVC